jgi:hypothetical protein
MAKRGSSTQSQKHHTNGHCHGAEVTLKYILSYPGYEFSIRNHKVMIAGALNELVCNEQLIIYGYLITAIEIYMVIACDENDPGAIQKLITDALRRMIRLDKVTGEVMQPDHQVVDLHPGKLNCIVVEDALVTSLLTGGRLLAPFTEYYYVRLQKQILTDDFSSAIDYSGGIGPVIVVCEDRSHNID